MIDALIVEATGCEAFAKLIYTHVALWLAVEYPASLAQANGKPEGLTLLSVEVAEHGANSAIYAGDL